MADQEWTDADLANLTRMWAEGRTSRDIAAFLGRSRNGVLGKARRLELPARAVVSATPRGQGKAKLRAARVAARAAGLFVAPVGRVVPFRPAQPTTNKPCCWPIGEPRDAEFRFCSDPTVIGKSYCETHARVAYRRAA